MGARSASVATRILLVQACLLALGLGTLPAQAGSVEGRVARIEGLTREDSSFGGRVVTAGTAVMHFGEETFSAAAIAGRYRQKGKKLHFEVAEEMLQAYAASWELAFAADLAEDGLEPDALHCWVRKARVKGHVRGDRIKFKSTFKIRCTASGDFGRITERARVRFRGRGLLEDAGSAPELGLGWNHLQLIYGEESRDNAGAGITISTDVLTLQQDGSVLLLAGPDVVLLPRLDPIAPAVELEAGVTLLLDDSATLRAIGSDDLTISVDVSLRDEMELREALTLVEDEER